ncbi:MAG: hypothetical protein IH880_03460 [Candidatus Marinimicrobia bacterium]|nr:hypothetical protein [Candidatus Neomarinimicrobiota bacterium]
MNIIAEKERVAHKSSGLVALLKKEYVLSDSDWSIIEEAAIYEHDWALIGDLFYRYGLEQRMLIFFEELKDYTMQVYGNSGHIHLEDKYPFEYLIALVTGCLETPSKEGGCDYSCGLE